MLFEMSSLPRLGASVMELPKSSVPEMSYKARFRVPVCGAAASAVVHLPKATFRLKKQPLPAKKRGGAANFSPGTSTFTLSSPLRTTASRMIPATAPSADAFVWQPHQLRACSQRLVHASS